MGVYHDKILEINISEKVEAVKSVIKDVENNYELEPKDIDYYTRFHVVLAQLESIINMADPYMLRITLVEELAAKLSTIIEKLDKINDGFYSTLNSVNDVFDEILDILSGIVFARTDEQVKGLRESTKNLRRLNKKYLSEIEIFYSDSVKKFEETASSLSANAEKLDSKVKELDDLYEERHLELYQQFEEKVSDINTKLDTELEGQKGYLDDKISNLESVVEEKTDDIISDFEEKIQGFLNGAEVEYKKKNESWEEKFKQQYDNLMEQVTSYKSSWEKNIADIEKVAGALAEHSMAYSYKNIADREKKSKDNWNKLTILGFVLLMCYGGIIFYISFKSPFSWENLMGRLSMGIGIGTFIAYTGRQASIHGRVERYCRETEIELASLGPYFAEFKDKPEELLKIRMNLAERFFGKGDIISGTPESIKKEDERINELFKGMNAENIKALLDLVKKIK